MRQAGDFSEVPADAKKLLRVRYIEGKYIISNCTELDAECGKLLLVLKALLSHQPDSYKFGYKLREGMVVQLGNARLLVKEIFHPAGASRCEHLAIPRKFPRPSNTPGECRICGAPESTAANPLVSPCKCSGSIKYVHVECMRAWHESKTDFRAAPHSVSYSIRRFECELCKSKFSIDSAKDGLQHALVNIARPTSCPYVMLESLADAEEKQIHIVTLSRSTPATIVLALRLLGERKRERLETERRLGVEVPRHSQVVRQRRLPERQRVQVWNFDRDQ